MHLNLLKAIPADLRNRIDQEFALLLQVNPIVIHTIWPRCKPIIGFHSPNDLTTQACKQYLSNHQCIFSSLLFGLSICPFYLNNGPVVSRDVAARYLNNGIRAVFTYKEKLDLSWLMSGHIELWHNICQSYVEHAGNGASFPPHLVEFAHTQIVRAKAVA